MPRTALAVLALILFSPVTANAQAASSGRGVGQGLTFPLPTTGADYYDDGAPSPDKVELGRMLFFDKILSGNRNISCATCHHSLTDTGDGLSLSIGEGGDGLGMARGTGVGANEVPERVPRNAPHVFNLGAREFQRMFYDGRLEVDAGEPSGFRSPAGALLPTGLDNVLAAQAMFPVTSGTEMAGQFGENPIGTLATGEDVVGIWAALAERLQSISAYVTMFETAYADVAGGAPITYVHAANAIAAFEASAWRADNSPFDRYLRGDKGALSMNALKGARLFYGKAGCSDCHAGIFQSDQQFHAIAMPQIGPGKGDDADGHSDFGRERVTGDVGDRFRFRTPTLRNVALTGPWGHTGAYNTLQAMVDHHFDPVDSLYAYDQSQAALPPRPDLDAVDFIVMNDAARLSEIAGANELDLLPLSEDQIDLLIDFLNALTDPGMVDIRADTPFALPSGLPLAD